jgi:DNA-binding MarR family transcriptional regulator
MHEGTDLVAGAPAVDAVHEGLESVLRVTRRARQQWAEEHPGVPAGHIALLQQVERLGDAAAAPSRSGCRLKDLATTLGLDASTVSREVAHLIAIGLVERRADPADGRAARLALTLEGHRQLELLRAAVRTRLADAVRSWETADVEAFADALNRFADGLAAGTTTPPHRLLEVSR